MNHVELVRRHIWLPRKAATVIFPRVRRYVELDDLIALGNAGLYAAARRFDPEKGVPFERYAWYRVYGAIIDGLRRATPLPKRTWQKMIALRDASARLEQLALDDDGAGDSRAALLKIQTALSEIRRMYMVSLDELRERDGDVVDAARGDLDDAGDELDRERLRLQVCDAVAALPHRYKTLLVQHYWRERDIADAGAELGVSRSWASRMHACALATLRRAIEVAGEPGSG